MPCETQWKLFFKATSANICGHYQWLKSSAKNWELAYWEVNSYCAGIFRRYQIWSTNVLLPILTFFQINSQKFHLQFQCSHIIPMYQYYSVLYIFSICISAFESQLLVLNCKIAKWAIWLCQ